MARYFSAEAKNIAETRSTQAKETGVGSEETITVFEPDLDNFKKREKKKHFLPSKVEELNKSRWNISGGEQKLKQQNSGQDGKKGKAKKGFREVRQFYITYLQSLNFFCFYWAGRLTDIVYNHALVNSWNCFYFYITTVCICTSV